MRRDLYLIVRANLEKSEENEIVAKAKRVIDAILRLQGNWDRLSFDPAMRLK